MAGLLTARDLDICVLVCEENVVFVCLFMMNVWFVRLFMRNVWLFVCLWGVCGCLCVCL